LPETLFNISFIFLNQRVIKLSLERSNLCELCPPCRCALVIILFFSTKISNDLSEYILAIVKFFKSNNTNVVRIFLSVGKINLFPQ
jgi:hypothetical protein